MVNIENIVISDRKKQNDALSEVISLIEKYGATFLTCSDSSDTKVYGNMGSDGGLAVIRQFNWIRYLEDSPKLGIYFIGFPEEFASEFDNIRGKYQKKSKILMKKGRKDRSVLIQ